MKLVNVTQLTSFASKARAVVRHFMLWERAMGRIMGRTRAWGLDAPRHTISGPGSASHTASSNVKWGIRPSSVHVKFMDVVSAAVCWTLGHQKPYSARAASAEVSTSKATSKANARLPIT